MLKNKVLFECDLTVEKDVTAYGNQFWLQIKDTQDQDHSFLSKIKGKTFKAIIILEEPTAQDEGE